MKATVEREKNLHLRQTLIDRLIVEDGRVVGVEDHIGVSYHAKSVIITTGTFLNGLIHVGTVHYPAGRAGEMASLHLAESLRTLGFEMGRMKTGTPPRLRASTICGKRGSLRIFLPQQGKHIGSSGRISCSPRSIQVPSKESAPVTVLPWRIK
jgi:glucose-inhibited division protein A